MPIYDWSNYMSNPSPDYRSDVQKENSKLAIYDPNNPDIANAEREAEDYINQGGAPMKLYMRVDDTNKVDDVYDEDTEPQFSEPMDLKGLFVPEPVSTTLKKWGTDTISEFKVSFSRAVLIRLTNGRLIREGDILRIPHNTLTPTMRTYFKEGSDFILSEFEVLSGKDIGNFNYRWLYWEVHCKNITGDTTIGPRK